MAESLEPLAGCEELAGIEIQVIFFFFFFSCQAHASGLEMPEATSM